MVETLGAGWRTVRRRETKGVKRLGAPRVLRCYNDYPRGTARGNYTR